MATSIGTEVAEFYYNVLLHYYDNFKKRLPTELEKLTIKEAAQFGKLQNSEEDYIEIYSRIHGVSAEQARDERIKEFHIEFNATEILNTHTVLRMKWTKNSPKFLKK
mgnify:CR=1 FL=1